MAEVVCRYVLDIQPRKLWKVPRPWAQSEPVLGWENRAGTYPATEGVNVSMTFWQNGRRATRPFAPSRQDFKEKQSVMIVGCSFTQGFGVSDEQTFPWLLAEWNNEFVVENFGTGGYGTYQCFLRIRKELEQREKPPCLVVYGLCWFHIDRNVGDYGWLRGISVSAGREQELNLPFVRLAEDGRLQEFRAQVLPIWPLELKSSLITMLSDFRYKRLHNVSPERMRQVNLKLIKEIDEYVRSKGSAFVVAILCDFPEMKFQEDFQKAGIGYVNCNPAPGNWYSTRMDLRVVSADGRPGGHPNADVHRHWAKQIQTYIHDHPIDHFALSGTHKE
jgi:hypothetical protein